MRNIFAQIRQHTLGEAAIFLLCVFLPVQTQYLFSVPLLQDAVWQQGVVRIFAIEIFVWLVLFGYVLTDALKQIRGSRIFLFFMLMALFAFWIFPFYGMTLRAVIMWIHVSTAIALYAVLAIAARRYGLRPILIGFLCGAIFSSVFGMYQYGVQETPQSTLFGLAFHHPELRGDAVVAVASDRILRAYGPLPHPNIFGGYLMIACMAALFLYPTIATKRRAWFLLAVTSIVIALLWTYSRSAWLGTLVLAGIAIGVYRHEHISFPKRGVGIFLGVLCVAVVFSWQPIATRLGLASWHPLEQRSAEERIDSLRDGWDIFSRHWLLGVGIGRYTDILQEQYPDQPGFAYQPAHNMFLLLLTEWGVFGVAMLLVLLWSYFSKCAQWFWFVPVMVVGLFDYYWLVSGAGLLLMIFAWFLSTIPSLHNWLACPSSECAPGR